MHGSAAFETYVHSSGGRRVGTEIQRMLSFAASRALRGGTLRAITDRYSALSDKTLYVPGQEPVQLRALGSRTLYDVPRSEVSVLI